LIDVSNMMPGDTVRTKITVESLVDFAFNLSVEIRNLKPEEENNPAENFIITFYRGGTRIARFGTKQPDLNYPQDIMDNYYPMNDPEYPVSVSAYPFKYDYAEKFNPGSSTELEFEIHLLGPETGNQYQNKPARIQWLFTAIADELPLNPPLEPPPTTPPAIPVGPVNPVTPEPAAIQPTTVAMTTQPRL